MMRGLGVVLVSILLGAIGFARGLPDHFDVASVKPAAPNRTLQELVGAFARRPPPGQWRLVNLTLRNAIILAYLEFQPPAVLVGGPDWVKEARFDLQARMSPSATHAEVQTMFRHLLEDRFALRTHVEQRMVDVYLLTLKTPGKFGPGLTRAPTPCVVWRLTGGRVPIECDLYGRAGGAGSVSMSVATIADLIQMMTAPANLPPSQRIPTAIDRPVLDRTGLDGYFQLLDRAPGRAPDSNRTAHSSP
jgi:uncharacterized protein (TIGR03435 family)